MNISDQLLLRRFGLRVPKAMVSEIASSLRTDQNFKKYLDKITSSIGTMTNEDNFLDAITSSHESISSIPENSKVIYKRDNTFMIKAINSQNIKSLTQRAFFNSFNLQRNVPNDLDEENKNIGRRNGKQRNTGEPRNQNGEGEEEAMCICGKNIPGAEWIQCSNEGKCRGSNWYHFGCVGIDPKEADSVKDKQFTCDRCKRDFQGDDESVSQSKKRLKEDES